MLQCLLPPLEEELLPIPPPIGTGVQIPTCEKWRLEEELLQCLLPPLEEELLPSFALLHIYSTHHAWDMQYNQLGFQLCNTVKLSRYRERSLHRWARTFFRNALSLFADSKRLLVLSRFCAFYRTLAKLICSVPPIGKQSNDPSPFIGGQYRVV